MTLDLGVHLAELALVLFVLPGLKKLVGVLIALQQSVATLTITMDSHREAFTAHVREDQEHFHRVDDRAEEVGGNVRELIGLMRLERRAGFERRDS